MTDPLGQVESYAYYGNNSLKSKTDRNGQTAGYTHNSAWGPLTTTVTGSNGSASVSNTYSKTGALIRQEESGMAIDYQYDDLGRLINVTEPEGITKTYEYNLNNQVTSFLLKQSGQAKLNLTYSYDALDRLSTVSELNQGSATQIASYGYDQNGNRVSQTFDNGVSSEYTYNKANLIQTLTNNKGGEVLSKYAYQYYNDGNTYRITDHNNVVTTYAYDGLNRLKSETYGDNYTKTYSLRHLQQPQPDDGNRGGSENRGLYLRQQQPAAQRDINHRRDHR
jgi:YD repeat-containing protein